MLAIKQRRQVVRIYKSNLSLKFFYLFYREGLIKGFTFSEDLKYLIIFLKYVEHNSLIKGFKFISRPSRYIYVSKNQLLKFFYPYGFFVISTSTNGISFLHNYIYSSNSKLNNCLNTTQVHGGVIFFQLII